MLMSTSLSDFYCHASSPTVAKIADIILCLPIARGSILPSLVQELDELTVHDFL